MLCFRYVFSQCMFQVCIQSMYVSGVCSVDVCFRCVLSWQMCASGVCSVDVCFRCVFSQCMYTSGVCSVDVCVLQVCVQPMDTSGVCSVDARFSKCQARLSQGLWDGVQLTEWGECAAETSCSPEHSSDCRAAVGLLVLLHEAVCRQALHSFLPRSHSWGPSRLEQWEEPQITPPPGH